jgi:four helix bundle protein
MTTIKNPEELVAWQLASDLKKRVYQILKRPRVARDLRFCDQIRRSARSAPANLAEGLGRYRPKDNAKFVRIALGSLRETRNHLVDAHDEEYLDDTEFEELRILSDRAIGAAVCWHTYLKNCPERPPEDDDPTP